MESFSNIHRITNSIKMYNCGWYDHKSEEFSLRGSIDPMRKFYLHHMPYQYILGFKDQSSSDHKVSDTLRIDCVEHSLESSEFSPFGSGFGDYLGKR